jgi:predicted TIM-barrel fold metal-dependent hydrolase
MQAVHDIKTEGAVMSTCLPPDPVPAPPLFDVPAGSCDTHCHIMGPAARFPYAEHRSYTPADAPLENYLAMRRVLKLSRSVFVQPGPHGFDNAVTLDAIRRVGEGARGIAVVQPSIGYRELERLHEGGIRGIRLSTMLHGSAGLDDLTEMATRVFPFDWHVVVHLKSARELIDLAMPIRALPVPVVIDHLGRITGSSSLHSAAFRTLIELLTDTDHTWTKISSWYRLSSEGPPYRDMERFARAAMEARPDRILWGSNWPHPMLTEPPMPNDGDLFNQFLAWAETDQRRKAILVDNPAALYGF